MSKPPRAPSGFDPSELETLRGEVRLRLHLANKELREQWERLEERLIELEHRLAQGGAELSNAAGGVSLDATRLFRDFVLRHLPERRPGKAPVHDAMRARVFTVGPSDTLARAAELMWENDVGCLPVVDAQRKALAMITDRDVAMAAFMQWVHLSDSRVASAMSKTLFYCSPDDEISQAAALMQGQQIRRLPVLDAEGLLVGLISLGDVARYVRMHAAHGAASTPETRALDAFVSVCEPRRRSGAPQTPSKLEG